MKGMRLRNWLQSWIKIMNTSILRQKKMTFYVCTKNIKVKKWRSQHDSRMITQQYAFIAQHINDNHWSRWRRSHAKHIIVQYLQKVFLQIPSKIFVPSQGYFYTTKFTVEMHDTVSNIFRCYFVLQSSYLVG